MPPLFLLRRLSPPGLQTFPRIPQPILPLLAQRRLPLLARRVSLLWLRLNHRPPHRHRRSAQRRSLRLRSLLPFFAGLTFPSLITRRLRREARWPRRVERWMPHTTTPGTMIRGERSRGRSPRATTTTTAMVRVPHAHSCLFHFMLLSHTPTLSLQITTVKRSRTTWTSITWTCRSAQNRLLPRRSVLLRSCPSRQYVIHVFESMPASQWIIFSPLPYFSATSSEG